MGEEQKKITGFPAMLAQMSPEEKKAWYAARRNKISAQTLNRREEINEWKQETLKKLALFLKEEKCAFDDPTTPITEYTMYRIHDYLKLGFSVLDVRDRLLADGLCSEFGWNRLKKALFDKHIARIEDLGIDIFTSQQRVLEGLQNQIRYLEGMKKKKPFDVSIPKTIGALYVNMQTVQDGLMKMLAAVGSVGEKNKKGNTQITVISNIPRPQIVQEQPAIDVTPEKKN